MKERQKVAALKYNKKEREAPKVVGLGTGVTAEKIIELAKEHNIPLYNDEKLVNQLLALELGSTIPPELFKVVAEILVFVYSIDQKKK